ncbi:MAG: leucine--tRNA ligase [Planctomycetota bacterium]|nr:MAG: leucine--tRNA ligase [Planctomycetota bacterium]
MAQYNFIAIEKKWQQYWQDNGTFHQPGPGQAGFDAAKPKMYVLDMFPYPSGAGLHVGHPEGYTATDIVCRYKRMKGYNVLHPMGYDSFGLPAEQYAVEHGVHPRETTEKNIANIERQIKMFGFSYDWSRKIATTDVEYYRWTQWIFLKMFNSWYDPQADAARPIEELINKLESGELLVDLAGRVVEPPPDGSFSAIAGLPAEDIKFAELTPQERREVIDTNRLAYMAQVPVNWCPKLGTVLANEEVTNEGKSERGNYPVFRRNLKQWMLRITAYATRLLEDIELVDWPEPIKIMQRNWIGKSHGASVDFEIASPAGDTITVYTTRPDTLYGATYMVLAPEHPLLEQITTPEHQDAVADYLEQVANRSDLERMTEGKDKTGVFTGAYAINPLNEEQIPIWTADYVMMGYGTGAIMAVPAHDTRDHEFAMRFALPIRPILRRRDEDDARYVAEMTAEQFDMLWKAMTDDPSLCPALRGIGAGNIDSFAPAGRVYNPAVDDPNINPILRMSIQTKRMIFVGPDGLSKLVAATCPNLQLTPYPQCTAELSDELEYIHSGPIDGLAPEEGKARMIEIVAERELGRAQTRYKLRDWLFSRQRYWGEPFPIVHCDDCGAVALGEDQLPLTLPAMADFSPAVSDDPTAPPEPPLGKMTDWLSVSCPRCDKPARRELNTMPQWAGSCWYYLRYLDPENSETFCDRASADYWLGKGDAGGVDLYVGGAEHAVLHLLYSRFWHKVLFDLGYVSSPEPFAKLFNQGMITSFTYRNGKGVCVPNTEVDFREDGPHDKDGEKLTESVEKMSKSLKNVVNPDDVIGQYGADTFRLYEMFMGPLDASKPWNTRDVPGLHRFLQRAWRLVVDNEEKNQPALLCDQGSEEVEKALHKLIKKAGLDIEAMKFNTAIAAMMEFVNTCFKAGGLDKTQAQRFVLVLAPFAPHIAEELWQKLGHGASLAHEPFPTYDEAMLVESTIELPVQVNGKVRAKITVPADAPQDDILTAAMAQKKVDDAIGEKTVVKKIIIPGRLVNLVVK